MPAPSPSADARLALPSRAPTTRSSDFFGIRGHHAVPLAERCRFLRDARLDRGAERARRRLLHRHALASARRAEHRRFLERWAREAPRILPIERGGYVYRLEQPDDQDQPSLWCEAGGRRRRLVVDVGAESATIEPELISVSPSGRYVAYGLARGGRDGGEIHVWDAVSGRTLADTIATTAVPTVAWHPSERGFFYNVTRRIIGAEIEGQDDGVYWHRLGDAGDRGRAAGRARSSASREGARPVSRSFPTAAASCSWSRPTS